MDSVTLGAIAVGLACNLSCALLGCYLVLRRMSLMGDAISHGVLPGIAVAFFLTGQLTGAGVFLGAVALGVLTAYLTQTIHGTGTVTEDASMGVVFTALFALGVVLVNQAGNVHLDLECVLYGDLLNTALDTTKVAGLEVPRALRMLGPVLALTVLFVVLFWKELKISSFDPALAGAMGLRPGLVHYLLMAMVGVATVASFRAVGSVLVVAMLVVPAACAHLLTDGLTTMLLASAVVAAVATVLGYLGAVWLNTAPAGLMAAAAGLELFLAVFLAPRHGLVSKAIRTLRLRLRIAAEDVLSTLYRAEESGGMGLPLDEVRQARGGWARLALPGLRRGGDVAVAEGRVALTDEGRQRARSLVRAHRLWESYLGENLQLPADHLHDPAERMEHYLDPALQAELARELSQPEVDPHGRAIPPS